MIELPEAVCLSRQLHEVLAGKIILRAEAGSSPHGFAWYSGDPSGYAARLSERRVVWCENRCGHIWIRLENDASLILSEGPSLRVWQKGEKLPKKHQLLLEMEDGLTLTAATRMYAFYALNDGLEPLNPYLKKGVEGPNVMDQSFAFERFCLAADQVNRAKLSVKGFLATEQRFPGLGNGVLQDILFNASLNPRRPLDSLGESGTKDLFDSVKETLRHMTELGGRDTESDVYGQAGGYMTILSRKGMERGCPNCGSSIVKEAYMGGSVYWCPRCQSLG